MPTLGFSYLLKLLSMNERPQRSALRARLRPSDGGYDFHRSLRLHAKRLLEGGEPLADLLLSANAIVKAPERNSVISGLEQLAAWREHHPGGVLSFPARTFESPDGRFKIGFLPDFGLVIDGRTTAVHVWNTMRPPLVDRMVYAALSLLPAAYADVPNAPTDFAVLSLRSGRLYRLSEAADHSLLARRLMAMLDRLISDLQEEFEILPRPDTDRPAAE